MPTCCAGMTREVPIGLGGRTGHAHGLHEAQQILHALGLLQRERRRWFGARLLLGLQRSHAHSRVQRANVLGSAGITSNNTI